jgi:integrase
MRRFSPESRCTPVADWPAQDRAAWLLARRPRDPFEADGGQASHLKISTGQTLESGYGRWLGWLERTGQLDAAAPPGSRVTLDRVKAYRDALRALGQADYTVGGRLQQLSRVLSAISPESDWSWIHRAGCAINAKAVPARDLRSRMQAPADILRLAEDLMDAAEHGRFWTPCDRAKLFRDGLILALLVHRPLRCANFAALTLDAELDGDGDSWRIDIPGERTKNGEGIAGGWPEDLVRSLHTYLAKHRPQLMKAARGKGKPSNALWISQRGTAMSMDAITFQVRSRTEEEFGTPINPHTFRHIAATTIATTNPLAMGGVMDVLGHTSIRTSEKHYNRANSLGAHARYQCTVAEVRGSRRKKGSSRQPSTESEL